MARGGFAFAHRPSVARHLDKHGEAGARLSGPRTNDGDITMRRIAVALALTLQAAVAHAATPRDVVANVADRIAANYYDAAKGAKLAADLKAEAARGDFDRYGAPLDLAQALTDRLKPADAHFRVVWSAQPAGLPPGARPGPGPGPPSAEDLAQEVRQNHGFRAVERLPGNIALVTMSYFADFQDAQGPAKASADAAMAMTAGADAIIFDLRDNGGGSPAMVGYLVGHFVPEGADVYNTFRSRGPDEYERPRDPPKTGRRLEVPVYVLVSGRTGSAAESFAYTLKAARRATIVGEASAGAANPGGMAPVGDGFAVFVSGGSPVNPITKANWEGTGVTPDAKVVAGEALIRAQELALALLSERPGNEAVRTEAHWALEALGPATAPAGGMAGYAGSYGARTVAFEGGRLLVAQDRRPRLALKPVGEDLFAIEGAATPLRVRFERDAAGQITGMVQTTPAGGASRWARTR